MAGKEDWPTGTLRKSFEHRLVLRRSMCLVGHTKQCFGIFNDRFREQGLSLPISDCDKSGLAKGAVWPVIAKLPQAMEQSPGWLRTTFKKPTCSGARIHLIPLVDFSDIACPKYI
jgi:hypothetical protein